MSTFFPQVRLKMNGSLGFTALAGSLTLVAFACPAQAAKDARAGYCSGPAPTMHLRDGDWNGWGIDPENSRFQSNPGLTVEDLPRLKLKWAFGFPDQSSTSAQPTVISGRVFVGSSAGVVYMLSASNGCIFWTYASGAGVRTAVVIGKLPSGKWAAFFGDVDAWVHAVDAETGSPLWKVKVDDHPAARVTGSPTLADGRLYVPISSTEETWAHDPAYPCCTFRGSISALDAVTGKKIWQSYTVAELAKPYTISRGGVDLMGPAGAAIWSAPTIDLKRGLVYAATGNSYTGVDINTSDAVVAFDLSTGRIVWSAQLLAKDDFIVGCPFHPNCPAERGSDFDFGASPILRELPGGKQILVAAQKSGMVYGLDPGDAGKVLWQTRVGRGGLLGGIMWGPAADSSTIYVAVSDRLLGKAGDAGLYALDLASGAKKWTARAPLTTGNPAQSAAVSAIPGVVFSGAVNGRLRAYSAANGKIIWDFDTNRPFKTVNDVPANGGSIDGPGPVIAEGSVYTNSGYERDGGEAGNVLLAFSIDGK